MEQRERGFYAFRHQTLAHQGFIRPRPSAETRSVVDLIEQTFSHHIAVFDPNGQPSPASTPTASELAARFYQDHYVDVQLYHDVVPDAPIDINRFIAEVPFYPINGNRNNLSYLLGEVGTGKTAFINYLVTRHGLEWVRDKGIWYVRLDVDLFGDGRLLSVQSVVQGISHKVVRIFEKYGNLLNLPANMERQMNLLLGFDATKPVEMQRALSSFIRSYSEITGRTLFLVIDNLDYLYHLNDKTIFSHSQPEMERAAMRCVADIVAAFRHDGENGFLGGIGANVLFSLRPDSYSILRESAKLFHPGMDLKSNSRVVSVLPPNWRDVIEQRGGLLQYAIERQPKGRRRVQDEIIKPILEDLEFKPEHSHSLIYHLLKITNFGLRGVIEFLASYSWLGDRVQNEEEALGYERLMRSYPVGLLIYILGGRRRFSQATSEFPNIYLVAEREELAGDPADTASKVRFPHTYWLSRLILQFIAQQETDAAVTVPDIIDCFCAGPKAYSEHLVRVSLGNMSQAKVTNLIRVHKIRSGDELSLTVQRLSLTERAKHCLSDVFDRFFYLQLVVDDHLLPIPRVVLQHFKMEEFGVDYSYLCRPASEYAEKLKEMIRLKANQVSIFLEILASSFECERQRYRSCFDQLGRLGVSLPDLPAIRKGVYGELRHLSERHKSILDIDDLDRQARQLRAEIDGFLRTAYLGEEARLA